MASSKKYRHVLWGTAGLVALALLLPASPGCGEHEGRPALTKNAVPLAELPEPVSKAAARTLRGVKIDEAWKNFDRDGKLQSYEIRGRAASNGKIREVRVSTTGEILEEE